MVNIEKCNVLDRGEFIQSKELRGKKFVVYYYKESKKYGIWDTVKDQEVYYSPEQFVYGTALYDYRVESYPNYVHRQLWMLYEYNRNLASK